MTDTKPLPDISRFSPAKQVALLRCWTGASKSAERKARFAVALAEAEARLNMTEVAQVIAKAQPEPMYTMDGRPVSHDGQIRSMFVEVTDADGKRLGAARLNKLASPLARYFTQAVADHRMAYMSRDEGIRVGDHNGTPVIKVRGCQGYRSAVSIQLRALAAATLGATVRAY